MKKEKILELLKYTADENLINKIKKIASIYEEKNYIVIDKEKFLSIIDPKRVVVNDDIDDVTV
jgi:hypothetical protein